MGYPRAPRLQDPRSAIPSLALIVAIFPAALGHGIDSETQGCPAPSPLPSRPVLRSSRLLSSSSASAGRASAGERESGYYSFPEDTSDHLSDHELKRRSVDIAAEIGCHTFRATGITASLASGSVLGGSSPTPAVRNTRRDRLKRGGERSLAGMRADARQGCDEIAARGFPGGSETLTVWRSALALTYPPNRIMEQGAALTHLHTREVPDIFTVPRASRIPTPRINY